MQERNTRWRMTDAMVHFSEVIDRAINDGPQLITRHGKDTVVVISSAEWERLRRREGTLIEFLLRSPLRKSGLKIERRRDKHRPIKL